MVPSLVAAPRTSASIVAAVLTAALLPVFHLSAHAQASFERIKARGQVNVGYREDAAPFSYLDDRHKPIGYSIDFCDAVVARLATQLDVKNLRVNMVPIAVDRITTYLKDGTVDLLCSSTSDTPERRMQMAFSKPIYFDGVGVLVRKKDGFTQMAQLDGKQIAVIKNTTAAKALAAYRNSEAKTWKADVALNADAAFSRLQLGWVQGYARDKVLLAMQQASLGDAEQYAILPERLSTEAIAVALRKDDADMLALVDGVIAEAAASGKAGAWHDKWFVDPIPLYKQQKALGIPMSPELKASLASK